MNIVAHNITAMNAQRQFNINTSDKSKSAEMLSSGYRINRAADDAAGLSISEKMRTQIRGLNMGSKNTQDGISLLQVADGALAEVNTMLHRITELSVMAANDINSDEDRQCIQDEISQIMLEIDRICETTSFNDRTIFCGGEPNKKYMPITASEIDIQSSIGLPIELPAGTYRIAADENGFSINGDNFSWDKFQCGRITLTDYPLSDGTYQFDYKGLRLSINIEEYDANIKDVIGRLNGTSFKIEHPIVAPKDLLDVSMYGTILTSTPIPSDSDFTIISENGKIKFESDGEFSSDYPLKNYDVPGGEVVGSINQDLFDWDILNMSPNIYKRDVSISEFKYIPNISSQYALHIHPDNITQEMFEKALNNAKITYKFQYIEPHPDAPVQNLYIYNITGVHLSNTKIEVNTVSLLKNIRQSNYKGIEITSSQGETDTSPLKLWIQSGDKEGNGMHLEIDRMNTRLLGIDNLDVTTHETAGHAITSAKKALLSVNGNRSKIGAQYNRLEYTVKNVENTSENTASAESLIRDTNMADEMVKYSTKTILEQMGQSMMAQANQINTGVLKLLS